ncbi:SPFH domain-containing protein [Streptomyces sp. NPDC087897]|uniref:SPFH domain-containing protein n=1 Tax=Streptomyces sp. NPDC087897 TaxID=3365817 RepID=UPI0038099F1B
MTLNDDQSPRTSPTPAPHSLDDRLPPSLFAPPGKGSPPPLFGPVGGGEAPPDDEAARRPSGVETPEGGALPPPLSGRSGEASPADAGTGPPDPAGARAPEPPSAEPRLGPAADGPGAAGPAAGRPAHDRPAPARAVPLDGNLHLRPVRRARAEPAAEWTPHPSYGAEPGGAQPAAEQAEAGRPDTGKAETRVPETGRPPTGRAEARGSETGRPEAGKQDGRRSEAGKPGAGASEGAGPEAGRLPRRAPVRGAVDAPGPDTELDLVLDLAPGDRAASATFSVPVSVPAPAAASTGSTGKATTTTTAVSGATAVSATTSPSTPAYPARRHAVIANETTASIPVHLLFRDDQERTEAAALPPGVVRRPVEERAPATRRPPVPRAPRTRVRPSTRPAPDADPRLTERPGPALPGSAALLVGAAAIAGGLAVLGWRGVLPAAWQTAVGLTPRPDLGVGAGAWALLAVLGTVALLALGGLGRGRVGYAWVLTLFGDYRGSVRRTGLVWVSPLLLRRRVDVRLRHWRSEPLPAVDATGTALRVVVLVVWRIKDTVRAALGIEDHEAYLSAQVEAALARVLSQLPADAFHEDAPSLRDAEAVGDALTRLLKADCEPVGVEVYSAQPTGIEYAPEVAAAMQRRRIAAIDSKHRDSVLTSVVDAVDDTVNRLTTRGIVELDDYERKALVKDLTVAFYTGRSGGGDGA